MGGLIPCVQCGETKIREAEVVCRACRREASVLVAPSTTDEGDGESKAESS